MILMKVLKVYILNVRCVVTCRPHLLYNFTGFAWNS